MFDSFEQKVRKNLDRAFVRKGRLFWLIFPVLFIISLVIFFVATHRRKKGYAEKSSSGPKVICVGNIIVGGSGKSPVVQKIALEYLKNGYVVAIAARGVGKNIHNVYVSNDDDRQKINFLSDENREHYELLKLSSPGLTGGSRELASHPEFYILQNKNRAQSLQYFTDEIARKNKDCSKSIFILDDGLQHYSCPRDKNICLWSPALLLESPYYAMPLGPYREGFGKDDFKNLLETFDFRFWSRTIDENKMFFKSDVERALKKFFLVPNEKDIIVIYEIIYWEMFFSENNVSLKKEIRKEDILEKFNDFNTIGIVTGVAHPENFISDISSIFGDKKINSLFLNDHSLLTNEAFSLLKKSDVLILTLKDLFRWSANPCFLNEIKAKVVIGCSVDVSLCDMEFLPWDI